jgi:hypothetical protein
MMILLSPIISTKPTTRTRRVQIASESEESEPILLPEIDNLDDEDYVETESDVDSEDYLDDKSDMSDESIQNKDRGRRKLISQRRSYISVNDTIYIYIYI